MRHETVLIVDDDEAVGKLIQFCLEKQGYTALLASSAEQAVAVCHTGSERIDLVLSDVMMPGGHGPNLEQQLRDLGISIPIIYMSGFPHIERINRGMADFVSKPFDCQTIADRVNSVLAQHVNRRPGAA